MTTEEVRQFIQKNPIAYKDDAQKTRIREVAWRAIVKWKLNWTVFGCLVQHCIEDTLVDREAA